MPNPYLYILRILCVCLQALLVTRPALAFETPSFRGDVLDEVALLNEADHTFLVERIRRLREESGIWAAVYVASSLQGDTIESAAVSTFEKWQLGQAGKDNGLLVLIVPAERRMRIEVGYGLEGSITDALSKRIIDEVYKPAFREEHFTDGLISGFDVMAQAVKGETSLLGVAPAENGLVVDWGAFFQRFLLAVGVNLSLPLLFLAARRYGRGKGWAGAVPPAGETSGLFVVFGFIGVFFGLFFAVFGLAMPDDPEVMPALLGMNGVFSGLFFLPYAARARRFLSDGAYRRDIARQRLLRMRKRSPEKRQIFGTWFDPGEVTTSLGGTKPEPPSSSSGSSFSSSSSSGGGRSGGGRSGGGGASGSW